MANGRDEDGRPREGTPEYEWLYGARGPSDDEATKILRDDLYPQRGGGRRAATPPPYEQQRGSYPGYQEPWDQPGDRRRPPAYAPPGGPGGPGAPGPARGRGGRGPRRRRPPVGRLLLTLLVLWLVFLVGVPIWAWSNVGRIDALPDGDRPGEQPGTTYLIVGSDSRAGLSDEERRRLGTGSNEGDRTDTIMMIHTGDGEPVVVSFPRDLYVDVPGGDRTLINGVVAQGGGGDAGMQLLVRTVESVTGVRVDHVAQIGMGGVAGVVDAIGGIEICPDEPIKDDAAHLDIPGGCQEVDGVTALSYSRARCSKNTAAEGCPLVRSDLDRIENQREVVSSVGREVASPWNVVNPFRYVALNKAATSFIAVDDETNVVEAARLALAMRAIGGGSRACTVPTTPSGSHLEEDTALAEQLFGAIADDDVSAISEDVCPT